MSWNVQNAYEALVEEYGGLSRHAAKLQTQLDEAATEIDFMRSGLSATEKENVQILRDLAFWRGEAARLSTECKNERTYIDAVGASVNAQRAELDKLIADARSDAFRRGWLHGLDDLDEVLAHGVLDERRARARAYDIDDCGTIACGSHDAPDDSDIPF